MTEPTNSDLLAAIQDVLSRLEPMEIDLAVLKEEMHASNGNLAALNAAYRQHGLQIGALTVRSTPVPLPDEGDGAGDLP